MMGLCQRVFKIPWNPEGSWKRNTSNSSCSTPPHPPHRHARKQKNHWTIFYLRSSHHIAIDWFSEELFGAGEEAACEEDRGGCLVEQLERPVVDRYLVHLVCIYMHIRVDFYVSLFRFLCCWDLVHLVCINTSNELTHNGGHRLVQVPNSNSRVALIKLPAETSWNVPTYTCELWP